MTPAAPVAQLGPGRQIFHMDLESSLAGEGGVAAMRVCLVIGTPAPYRVPVWESLGSRLADFQVLLCSETEAHRVWEDQHGESRHYTATVLPGVHRYVWGLDYGFHWNPTLLRELRARRPDCVMLHGYDTPSQASAFLWAKWNRVPIVLVVEGHAGSSRITRGPIAALRRYFVRNADVVLAHGELGRRTILDMGVREDRLVVGTLAVDVERIARSVDGNGIARTPPSPGRAIRFLYVGQLIERKGPIQLIDAIASLPRELATLDILGYGPLEEAVRQRIAELRAGDRIRILEPTRTVEATAAVYAGADVFVMPSTREVWGLVVNEALAAGTYVLSSKEANVTGPLIERAPHGVGRVIAPDDAESLRRTLEECALEIRAHGLDRPAIARWGRSHTPARLADAMLQAIARAAGLAEQPLPARAGALGTTTRADGASLSA